MRIAIIGAGIAGLTAARELHTRHEITVFEAADWIGGHTHTVDIDYAGRKYAIDTGFIVFNDWTYPNFLRLLVELGVETQPSTMSFSVRCERTGLEYNGTSLNTLFAQRGNLLRPSFYSMIREILRFNREAPRFLQSKDAGVGLGDFLRAGGYGSEFVERYLVPMGAAIWSADPGQMFTMPASFFIRFFANHGMLSIDERPQWRVVRGGSRAYVEALIAPFRERIRTRAAVLGIRRSPAGVDIDAAGAGRERFEAVFVACHSDQALRLLRDPTRAEREVLGAIPYQPNDVVLHTDTRLLPRRQLARAAWNYRVLREPRACAAVTYDMNRLQSLDAPATFCVTLNGTEVIDPTKIIGRWTYEHPQFTPAAVAAQARHSELNGPRDTWYCGAYWGYGFHEDGVVSALTAVRDFEEKLADAQLSVRRVG